MRVKVYNKQQYAIGRGGHVFPPKQETEVEVRSEKRLAEIKACVYLKVTAADEPPVETATAGESSGDVVEVDLEKTLDSKTKAELIAEFPGLGLTQRDGKPAMIAKILAALDAEMDAHGVDVEGKEIDFPPYAEWETDGLKQLAEEWELEVPEDADHEALVAIVQEESDRRQQLEAPPIESADSTPATDETAS